MAQAGENHPVNDQQANDFLVSGSSECDPLISAINLLYHADEASAVQALLPDAQLEPAAQARVDRLARDLVQAVRDRKADDQSWGTSLWSLLPRGGETRGGMRGD